MATRPNFTRLAKVGTSTGFVINKKVSALVGEMSDTFKIDINTERGQIVLTNTKMLGENKNE
jgi:ATP-dependent helicase YprA (DUF1998 family)